MADSIPAKEVDDEALGRLGDSFLEQLEGLGVDLSIVPDHEKDACRQITGLQCVMLAVLRAFPERSESEVSYWIGMATGNVIGQFDQASRTESVMSLIQGLNEGIQSIVEGFQTQGNA